MSSPETTQLDRIGHMGVSAVRFTSPVDWHGDAEQISAGACLWVIEHGLFQVSVRHTEYFAGPHHGIYLPPRIPHQVRASQRSSGWFVRMRMPADSVQKDSIRSIETTTLLETLVERISQWGEDWEMSDAYRYTVCLLIEELLAIPDADCRLQWPEEDDLLLVAHALRDSHGWRTLEELATASGLPKRTLTRRYREATGVSVGEWTIRLRVFRAMRMLSAGKTLSDVAVELGYESPGAFAKQFKLRTGFAPKIYQPQSMQHGGGTKEPVKPHWNEMEEL